jgi:class 3 adenylate cyclase
MSDERMLLEFLGFTLDPDRGSLLIGDRDIKLRPKTFDVLHVLLENAGRLVRREELINTVWPNVIVNEESVTQCVSELRQALGDQEHSIIKTIARRGYLLDASVRKLTCQDDLVARQARVVTRGPERRQVTILVCNVLGSSPAEIDPEDLREIMTVCHACVSRVVEQHGGSVGQTTAEGLLAYFGFPQAHEDDAERAASAGLEAIRAVSALRIRSLALPLRLRVGIATGSAVLGDLGNGVNQHGLVGEAAQIASRLSSLAEPNSVVIEPSTRRLLGGLFDCNDLGEVPTRTGSAQTRIWQVLGTSAVENRFEALRAASTPLVGREEELEMLLRRWRHAADAAHM